MPNLSTLKSILPAFTSRTAFPTSRVTVPDLGFGIKPLGPNTLPSLPTFAMTLGIVMMTSISVQPPSILAIVGRLGRVLGPRGLMPNPKSGTVTLDVGKAVREVKAGKIDFKVDKFGIIHAGIGKVSFTPEQIQDNVKELILTISKLKPSSSKGTYFKSIHLSSTMSPGISVDKGSIQGI